MSLKGSKCKAEGLNGDDNRVARFAPLTPYVVHKGYQGYTWNTRVTRGHQILTSIRAPMPGVRQRLTDTRQLMSCTLVCMWPVV